MEMRLRELFDAGCGFIDAMEILEKELKEIWTGWVQNEYGMSPEEYEDK